MPPKNPNASLPPPEEQGALFTEHVVHSGSTDPAQQKVKRQFEAAPDGAFSEPVPATPSYDPEFDARVHAAVTADHRRTAQLGKHSPLERDGTYLTVKPGDVLPGFGIVTSSNWPGARQHAEALEAQRQKK